MGTPGGGMLDNHREGVVTSMPAASAMLAVAIAAGASRAERQSQWSL